MGGETGKKISEYSKFCYKEKKVSSKQDTRERAVEYEGE